MTTAKPGLRQILWAMIICGLFVPSIIAAPAADALKSNYPGNKPPLVQTKFIRLPFGSVMPEGWLAKQLRIEADGLIRYLLDGPTFDRVLSPCTIPSEITYQKGVYQEGLVTLAWLTGDPVFLKRARESMEDSLAEDPGHLGDTKEEIGATMYIRARQTRAFIEYYEATRDPRVLPWLTEFFHAWGKSDLEFAWWIEAATTDLFLVGVWLYDQTGDPVILDTIKGKSGFADKVVASFLDFPKGEYEKHNVVVAWISRLPGILYELTAEDRLRKATFAGIDGRDQYWGILPTAPWNYALNLSGDEGGLQAQVVRNPIGDFPFAEKDEPVHRRAKEAVILTDGRISSYEKQPYSGAEPVILKVNGRLLPQWGMDKAYPANAADPPASPVVVTGPIIELELIPYGCARLRISEFPWFKN
jgi:hypothetical protein